MTILFLSRLFYPHIGGVERHVLEVGKRLIEKGHKVVVVREELSESTIPTYQLANKSARSVGTVEGIKIYRIPAYREDWFKKFRIWWQLLKLRQLIKDADIVHCHDVFFWFFPFRFIYPKKPVYITFHGYETKYPLSKKAILIRKISEKLSWGNICVGDYIGKWYGTNADYITYGGVNKIKNEKLILRQAQDKNDNEKLKILFIGRLEKDIGTSIYLKALELLKNRRVKFEFDACGGGSLRKEVERYGKVYGFVEDLSSYIEKADIVFASSYLSIMEAMKYKKLVFAVYNDPLKEDYLKMSPFAKWIVVENSGELVAEKIEYFIKHFEKKKKIIDGGYRWISGQTWQQTASLYMKLWAL